MENTRISEILMQNFLPYRCKKKGQKKLKHGNSSSSLLQNIVIKSKITASHKSILLIL